jgi:hypothetical protein
MNEHDHEMMIDSIREGREDSGRRPTQYVAPQEGQKWRARELFGFMWRHLGIKIPQGYRDVMLFLIEKANAHNGRVDWRQEKIAEVMGLGRQYVNEALQWWASETPYLKMERRKNKDGWYVSNAYHLRWRKMETAWKHCLDSIIHVGCNPTTDVASDPTTDVASDTTTRKAKWNGKGETHPERVPLGTPPISVRKNSKLIELSHVAAIYSAGGRL